MFFLFDAANALWFRVSDTVNKTVAEMDDVMFFAMVVIQLYKLVSVYIIAVVCKSLFFPVHTFWFVSV